MKKVLVPMAVNAEEEGVPGQKNFVRTEYVKKLCKHNLVPFPVSPFVSQDVLDQIYQECSGILFMGGMDFNPALYGEEPHPKTEMQPQAIENLELPLARRAVADRKPIIGICKGVQLLNVAFGGSLHQHVEDLNLDTRHGDVSEGAGYRFIGRCHHDVFIEKDTKLYQIVQKEQVTVNSAHHQGINRVAEQFRVSARCPSGLVEALEHEDPDYFCIAVQCHPEFQEESFFEELFRAYADALGS